MHNTIVCKCAILCVLDTQLLNDLLWPQKSTKKTELAPLASAHEKKKLDMVTEIYVIAATQKLGNIRPEKCTGVQNIEKCLLLSHVFLYLG